MPVVEHVSPQGIVPAGVPSPLPVAGGTVVSALADDFNTGIEFGRWVVSGSPSASAGVLTVANGQSLLSRETYTPPCLIEGVFTMNARVASDDFRVGFYRDDDNLVEWAAIGDVSTNMNAVMRAAGVENSQAAINVGAANSSYRLGSIYIGIGEVIYAFRPLGGLATRTEVYRLVEQGIPDGPFRVRLAGRAGTSQLLVHRVQAYQLADIIPAGALGHHVDQMAVPVRVTNGPWVGVPSSSGLGTLQAATDTFATLAAGAVGTGSTRAFFNEQCHIQGHFMGDQPFTWWVEAQVDGSNWQVVDHGTATDATTDAVVRYFGRSAILQLAGNRNLRVKIRNTGGSTGAFRGTLIATSL